MVSGTIIMCFVICMSLSFESNDFVIMSVSCIGILTYKSFISYVIILWFSFIFRFVKSSAKVVEFLMLYWLLRH
jgi:hypothetical protein